MRLVSFPNMIALAQMTTAGMEGSRLAILASRVNSGGFASLVPQGQQPIYGSVRGVQGGGGGSGAGAASGGATGGGGSGSGGGTIGGQNKLTPPTPPGPGVGSGVGGSGDGIAGNSMTPNDLCGRRGYNPKNRQGCPNNDCTKGEK